MAVDTPIPRYTIDLSLPPFERYQHLAKAFLPEIASLTTLFEEVVPTPLFRTLASVLLRRVYSQEQTAELRGIQHVTQVGMHLLVSLNVLLDLMMGCTSGGVRAHGDRMLHFRTLDWDMPALRKIIVHLDYVRDGARVAACVTYVGYVGVLTGVAKGLSVSLNYRPVHNARNWFAHLRFYFHLVLVLFGFRPSISSVLRELVIPTSGALRTLEDIERMLPAEPSTAAYLIFCDGRRTMTMEKDYCSAVINSSSDFIVVTNHDKAQELATTRPSAADGKSTAANNLMNMMELNAHEIVAESSARKRCMTQLCEQESKRLITHAKLRSGKAIVSLERLASWLETSPIIDALTHYAVIMDPAKGEFAWERYYPDPRALWDHLNEHDKNK